MPSGPDMSGRATVYRWLKGIRLAGVREFVRGQYRQAKKRPRRRRVDGYVAHRILSLRRESRLSRDCGEKIVWWLGKEWISLSRPDSVGIYRVLNRHLVLRPKGRRNPDEVRRGAPCSGCAAGDSDGHPGAGGGIRLHGH